MKSEYVTKAGTKIPLTNLKGKEYMLVPWRIVWFREEHPEWKIQTEIIQTNEKMSIVKAIIYDEKGNCLSSAHKSEKKFFDHLEKAETGAIGRALANCGYGTAYAIADFEDDEIAPHIVDTPLLSEPEDYSPPIESYSEDFAVNYGDDSLPAYRSKATTPAHSGVSYISDKQVKFLWVKTKLLDKNQFDQLYKEFKIGIKSEHYILKSDFNSIIDRIGAMLSEKK